MPQRCIVRDCVNEKKDSPGTAFFQVPNNPEIRKAWIEFANPKASNLVKKRPTICSLHFSDRDIKILTQERHRRSRLVKGATPTKVPPLPRADEVPSPAVVPSIKIEPVESPRKKARKAQRTSKARAAAKQLLNENRANVLDGVHKYRQLLRLEQVTWDNPFLPANEDEFDSFDFETLRNLQENNPIYNRDFLVRHPLITQTLDVADKATELFGMGIMEEKGERYGVANVLYKTAAITFAAARNMALTTLTPYHVNKTDSLTKATSETIEVVQMKDKLEIYPEVAFHLDRMTALSTALLSANAESTRVVSTAVAKSMAFATNLVFTKLECSNETKVLLTHQERPIAIPGCSRPGQTLCRYEDFRQLFRERIEGCAFEGMCAVQDVFRRDEL